MNYTVKDFVAQSYLSVDFVAQYIATTMLLPKIGLKEFYSAWQRKNSMSPEENKNEIFTPGLILGHLFVCLVLVQQEFFKKMPEIIYGKIDEKEWGSFEVESAESLKNSKLWKDNNWSNNNDLPLSYILKRIRNSLAHCNFRVSKEWVFKFYDDRNQSRKNIENFEFKVIIDFDNLTLKILPQLIQLLPRIKLST